MGIPISAARTVPGTLLIPLNGDRLIILRVMQTAFKAGRSSTPIGRPGGPISATALQERHVVGREAGLACAGTMAAPGWSERVRELLRRMNSFHRAGLRIRQLYGLIRLAFLLGSPKALCLPFVVAGLQVGHVPHSVARRLHQYPAVFSVSQGDEAPACLELNKQLVSFEERTAAVQGVLKQLREQEAFPCLKEWREELYSVMPYFCDTPLFSMERAATPLLGVKRYGTHLNGYTWQNGEMLMWLGRRALNKPTYPGLLDNLAAGGIASGLGVRETLVKECQEEACIPAFLAAQAKPVGTVTYTYVGAQGGIYPECQFVFDLELPEDFVPQVGDGEVQEFYLWPLHKVKEAIVSPDFKPNCAMVALDFLIRHSYIQPDEAGTADGSQKVQDNGKLRFDPTTVFPASRWDRKRLLGHA
uniref:uncharacterized protein LOC130477814 n=1 Tax=Euleptes europaea TaxID=460621 RepID=UPI002540AC7A|nr:uncharacterized protein LOC130477814 [Euleptes europaea]